MRRCIEPSPLFRINDVAVFKLKEWRINRQTMRFMSAYLIGYIDGNDEKPDTPVLTIGKCAPL